MKKLFAGLALCAFSLPAQAVDVTITLTVSQATRIAAACGKWMNLTDAKGTPRPCTMAEAKAWTIKLWREVVFDSEREDANKAMAITAFDPT